jgi:Cu(I)/Ag(I) efflux system protein CusF
MNRWILKWSALALCAMVVVTLAQAAATRASKSSNMAMGNNAKSATTAEHHGSGKVKSVDAAAGKVTLDHGPIKSIGWPAMTMGFAVKDPKQLEGLKPGRTVNFTLVKEGSDYVVSSIK